MSNIVRIVDNELMVKEFNGQRVVTFKDIDSLHNRAEGTARKRFNDNKAQFIKNEDYFIAEGPSEIRTDLDISKYAPTAILITESGYLMLVKSFTDDLAWQVQRQLVNSYFKVKTGNIYHMLKQKLDVIDQINNVATRHQKLQLYAEAMEETERETGIKFPPKLSSIKKDPEVIKYKLIKSYFKNYLLPNENFQIEVTELYSHYKQHAKCQMINELASRRKFVKELCSTFPTVIYHRQDNQHCTNAFISGIAIKE